MIGRRRVALPVACACALVLSAGDGGVARAQTDGMVPLLRRLEQAVLTGDAAAHLALLADTADRRGAVAFADNEFPPGLTHIVIQERDRQPLPGTLPGNGHRLVVDVFQQAGDRARVATWQLDVKRAGDEWLIAGEQRVTSVEALYKLSLNPGKQFAVRDLTIVADDLTLTLPDGFAFVADTDRGVAAMVLVGRGHMRFRPGPEAERGQVRIFCGSDTLVTEFDTVYLRMNPAGLESMRTLNALTPAPVDPRAFRRAADVFREELPKSFGLDLGDLSSDAWSLLMTPGDLLAEIRTRRFDTLTYARSSSESEDISLFDRKRRRNIALYASGRKVEERLSNGGDAQADIDVLDYDIHVTSTPNRQWIDGRAKLVLRVLAPHISSVTLRLASSLVVQSVVSGEYGRLFGVRVNNQNSLVINLPAAVPRDTDLSLTVTYAGRLVPQTPDRETAVPQQSAIDALPSAPALEPSTLYTSGSYWYPQPGAVDYATATLRITVPAGLDCVASGDLAEGSPTLVGAGGSAQRRKVYVFHATQPLRYLSFVVSRFAHAGRRLVDFPPDSWSATDGRDGVWYRSLDLAVEANPRYVARGRELGGRAAAIASFYQSILGDVPYPSFTVAVVEDDRPGGHSPGYFAVVNEPPATSPLSWRDDPATFSNYPDFFLAHELAHQWWGQAVGWRNYHEQWLSEGFSQYFAALYAEHEHGDEVFAGIMRRMRKWAIDASDQGPISLGNRLGHIRGDSRVFRALVYNKSAVVLHMLRGLVGDDAFFRGVRRFYAASRFQKVGTDEFRAAMEAETDRPLERFFERWIRGSRLPRMTFSYRVDGDHVDLRTEQLDDVFDFPLTVTLQYADSKSDDVVVAITERIVTVRLPLAGALRSARISRADGSLAETVGN